MSKVISVLHQYLAQFLMGLFVPAVLFATDAFVSVVMLSAVFVLFVLARINKAKGPAGSAETVSGKLPAKFGGKPSRDFGGKFAAKFGVPAGLVGAGQ